MSFPGIARAREIHGLDLLEMAVVRAALSRGEGAPWPEAILRTAIAMARLQRVSGPHDEVNLEAAVAPWREHVTRVLGIAGIHGSEAARWDKVAGAAEILRRPTTEAYRSLLRQHRERLPPETLDGEIRHKALVIAAGGGGGACLVYLGVFKALEDWGIRPALIAGSSMGALLGILRGRQLCYELPEMFRRRDPLSWLKTFGLSRTGSRFGAPAPVRLRVRESLGPFLRAPSGEHLAIGALTIPCVIVSTAIRKDAITRSLERAQRLLGRLGPKGIIAPPAREILRGLAVVAEVLRYRVEPMYFGLQNGTERLPAVDAVGYSSAFPPFTHYDIPRDDKQGNALLDSVVRQRNLSCFSDGALVENVPGLAVWHAVQAGMAGTRNVFLLALDGFAASSSSMGWRLIRTELEKQTARVCEFVHLYQSFPRTRSPLLIVPPLRSGNRILKAGEDQMTAEMPFIARMLKPLPRLLDPDLEMREGGAG